MNGNNKNDTTHKSEINATMAFTQSLAAINEDSSNSNIFVRNNFDKLIYFTD